MDMAQVQEQEPRSLAQQLQRLSNTNLFAFVVSFCSAISFLLTVCAQPLPALTSLLLKVGFSNAFPVSPNSPDIKNSKKQNSLLAHAGNYLQLETSRMECSPCCRQRFPGHVNNTKHLYMNKCPQQTHSSHHQWIASMLTVLWGFPVIRMCNSYAPNLDNTALKCGILLCLLVHNIVQKRDTAC